MTKKVSKTIGLMMLALAIIFFIYALCHPEMSFGWSNTVSYIIYIIYLLAMIFFMVAPFKKQNK